MRSSFVLPPAPRLAARCGTRLPPGHATMSHSPITTNIDRSPTLELGSQSLASWSQSLIAGGSCATAMGQVALHSEVGSLQHTLVLVGLVISLVAIFSNLLVKKAVTAISVPAKQILCSFSFLTVALYKKKIQIHEIAWVRVRFDGYQELLIEAGNQGFETTEILRVPYRKGSGVPVAEAKACQLAALWGVESKGYRGLA